MARFSIADFLKEARRRRVFRVVGLYVVGAWAVLQVSDVGFESWDIPSTALRYIWIGAFVGFPIALIFGWRYDFVGGRIVRTAVSDTDADLSIGRTDFVILAALAVVFAAITLGLISEISETDVTGTTPQNAVSIDPNSVAVLPFLNIGGNPENEYFSDGITETLLHALSQLPDLKVSARTSAFFYKGKDLDIRKIATQLGVSKILEGSVQHSGDRVRIVAQLIEADSGFHLWSNTYDTDLGDIFAIQDSIASNVVTAIQSTVAGTPGQDKTSITAVSTTNLPAYRKYLQGLEQSNIRSNVSLPQAESLFLQALAIEPDFFEARRELAYTYLVMRDNGTLEPQVALSRAEPLVATLLEERPDDGLTIVLDLGVRGLRSIDVDGYIARLIAAIERNSNDTRVHVELARLLQFADRTYEAIDWLNRALKVDPNDWRLQWSLGHRLSSLGEFQRAVEAYERVTVLNPKFPSGHSKLAWASWDIDDYVTWYRRQNQALTLDPLDPEIAVGLGQGLLGLGLVEESNEYLDIARKIDADSGQVRDLEVYHSILKDATQSLALTESLLRREPASRGYGHVLPAMAFVSVSIEAGLTEEALAVLEDILPGVTTEDFVPDSISAFNLQFFATIAWAQAKEIDEIAIRLHKLEPRWDSVAPFWRNAYVYTIPLAILRGDIDAASEIAVDSLTRVRNYWEVRGFQRTYPYNVVSMQPAVAAQLAEINEELRQAAATVQAYIEQENL